jgi:flagellar L-ring protein FlgH
MRNALIGMAALLAASGCSRLENVGKAPEFSPMAAASHDDQIARTISMPMPAPDLSSKEFNSLWASGNKVFFGDPRAKRVGDIITVLINIDDEAKLRNQTDRTRSASEEAGIDALFGLDGLVEGAVGGDLDFGNAAEFGSSSSNRGRGQVTRNEEINLRLAGVVTHVLPNGNLAIAGRQEVLVNQEMRDLRIAGVIRPQDISSRNEVSYDKIAEARIAYGGRGLISDAQQPRYGQQVFDIIMPW